MTKKLTTKLIETYGWIGIGLVFGAYAFSSYGLLQPIGITYQLINLIGGIGIMTESLTKRNYQPAVLNAIWSVVAVIAIAKALL